MTATNGLFESVRRHEFGWLDEADGVARTKITRFLLQVLGGRTDSFNKP